MLTGTKHKAIKFSTYLLIYWVTSELSRKPGKCCSSTEGTLWGNCCGQISQVEDMPRVLKFYAMRRPKSSFEDLGLYPPMRRKREAGMKDSSRAGFDNYKVAVCFNEYGKFRIIKHHYGYDTKAQ